MQINQENYYSEAANREYFSVSQYKSFMNCEARAMAEISGEYERPVTKALLVGSFVDRYFEGTLDQCQSIIGCYRQVSLMRRRSLLCHRHVHGWPERQQGQIM